MTELQGWAPRAAWDDFNIGVKHGGEFEKVALYRAMDYLQKLNLTSGKGSHTNE
jgi:hypothetical protein